MKKKKQQQRDMREGGRQGEEEERKVFCFSPGSAKRKPVYKAFARHLLATTSVRLETSVRIRLLF